MKYKNAKKNIAKRTAVDGVLSGVALALSFLESLLPDMNFLPPGAKLGLSNIAVMLAATSVGYIDALIIVLIKSGYVFITRGPASFFMSLSGGILSAVAMIIITDVCKRLKKQYSYIGSSIICAVVHNTGQTLAACVYTKTNLISSYLPLLIIFGIIAGAVTGVILKFAVPAIKKTGVW